MHNTSASDNLLSSWAYLPTSQYQQNSHTQSHQSTRRVRAASYCERCRRGFKSEYAILEHRRDSRRHWPCPTCNFDADGWDALLDHCRETDCRDVCQGCDNGIGELWRFNSIEYWQHVDDHNVCVDCEVHFSSPYERQRHDCDAETESEESGDDATDDESEHECLRCDRVFSTYGGMILHLESGCCSEVNASILDTLAARCNRWHEFIYEASHQDLLAGVVFTTDSQLYFCPTCNASMTKLSSLFQHVESGSCGQDLDEGVMGTLRRYLARYL